MNFMIFKGWFSQSTSKLSSKITPSTESGFTLIELLVVIALVGILAAIAAPGWLGFVNNRRANSTNDAVLQAINEAKNKARKEKRAYSVSLRTENNIPQIAIHPDAEGYQADEAADIANMVNYWQVGDLSQDVDIKANQILIQTNIVSKNHNADNFLPLTDASVNQTSLQTITFDRTGELAKQDNGNDPNTPLVIRVAVPSASDSTQPLESTIRCIKVQTLLGSLVIGRSDSECKAS